MKDIFDSLTKVKNVINGSVLRVQSQIDRVTLAVKGYIKRPVRQFIKEQSGATIAEIAMWFGETALVVVVLVGAISLVSQLTTGSINTVWVWIMKQFGIS